MTVDIYAPTSNDTLDLEELTLYHQIMAYRAANGLAAIPLSESLTLTAGRHAVDTYENIWGENVVLPDGANLHSWSDAFYYGDHRAPEVMWEAPARLGTAYPGPGFEISAAGYADTAAALIGWQGSPGHNSVILNQGIWASSTWTAIGIGVQQPAPGSVGPGPYGGRVYHVWFGREADPDGGPVIEGDAADNAIIGSAAAEDIRAAGGNDTINGGDGGDTVEGGNGDDTIIGGDTENDLADQLFGGAGNDSIDGGHGNDRVSGGSGNDTVEGGFGVDTIIGNGGDDVLTGSAYSDLIFGGDGFDFINGGFGHDRVNGGAGGDRFFHIGLAGHGSDWIQDYNAAEGDVLRYGGASRDVGDFQVNIAPTNGAGDAGVQEAFVIYRPTGQILWALIDGAGQDEINIQIGGTVYDLLA